MINIKVKEYITVSGLPSDLIEKIKLDLTLPNPLFKQAVKQGYHPNIPENLHLYMLSKKTGAMRLPSGYFWTLTKKIGKSHEVSIIDDRLVFNDDDDKDLTFKGTLRPYQQEALEKYKKQSMGILVAPPGAGKTVMIMSLVAMKKQPTLILCHTKDLAQQLQENVKRWLGVEPGFIGSGKWKPGESITVAMMQTLHSRPEETKELAKNIGCIILDEAHHCPAKTFIEVMQTFPAKYRYGFTATPCRGDGLQPFMEAVIGPVWSVINDVNLSEDGIISKPTLEWVQTEFDYDYSGSYPDMIKAMINDDKRNKLIINKVSEELQKGLRSLIITERVDHVKHLTKGLSKEFPGKVLALDSSIRGDDRQKALESLRNGSILCVVSTRLADEGLDVPQLERLFLVTPSKDPSKAKQRVGRVMRTSPGKAEPIIYDFVDRTGITETQAYKRWNEVYKELVICEPPPSEEPEDITLQKMFREQMAQGL